MAMQAEGSSQIGPLDKYLRPKARHAPPCMPQTAFRWGCCRWFSTCMFTSSKHTDVLMLLLQPMWLQISCECVVYRLLTVSS